MKNIFTILMGSAFLIGCVASAPSGFNKPNFSYNAYAPDMYQCAHAAEAAKKAARSNVAQNSSNYGGAFASGFIAGYSAQEQKYDTAMSCMESKGYVWEEVSQEEYQSRLQASKDFHRKKHPEAYSD